MTGVVLGLVTALVFVHCLDRWTQRRRRRQDMTVIEHLRELEARAMRQPTEKRAFAKWLTKHQTPAEHVLWRYLKDRKLGGVKFKRQAIICGYIADFTCPLVKLVIEVDGGVHDTDHRRAYDARRAEHMAAAGWQTLRFKNHDVFYNRQQVLADICERIGVTPPVVRPARRVHMPPAVRRVAATAAPFNATPRLVKR